MLMPGDMRTERLMGGLGFFFGFGVGLGAQQ
jgi:hypothetical protein